MMTDYFVESLIRRFEIEQRKNDRGGVYALTQRMLAYNSNKIEGSTLTEKWGKKSRPVSSRAASCSRFGGILSAR